MTEQQNPFQPPSSDGGLSIDGIRKPTRKELFGALSTAIYIGALLLPITCVIGIPILKNVIGLSSIGDSSLYVQVGFWAVLSIPSLVAGRLIFKSKIASAIGAQQSGYP